MNDEVKQEVVQEEKSVMTEQLELAPNTETKDVDPIDVSSMGYGLYFPVFKNLVNNKLSGSSAKRLLIALFANKLEPFKVNLKLEQEVECLKIANKLFEDILVLHLSALLQAESNKQDLIKSNKEKELTNGTETQVSGASEVSGNGETRTPS